MLRSSLFALLGCALVSSACSLLNAPAEPKDPNAGGAGGTGGTGGTGGASDVCGDGEKTGAEECDDGNTSDTDACTSACALAACGDGFVQAGVEDCDDANTSDTDACLSTCVAASCGDGFVQEGAEECDDANTDDTDACLATCAAAACGDGVIQAGVEQCDDGDVESATDACSAECKVREFDIATGQFGDERPSVAVSQFDGGKGFVVVFRHWATAQVSSTVIQSQRVGGDGSLVGSAATLSGNSVGQPKAATNPQGTTLVTYHGPCVGGTCKVKFRCINAMGAATGAEADFLANNPNNVRVPEGALITAGSSQGGDFALSWVTALAPKQARIGVLDQACIPGPSAVTLSETDGSSDPGVWPVQNGFVAAYTDTTGALKAVGLSSLGAPMGMPFDLTGLPKGAYPAGAYIGPNNEFIAVFESLNQASKNVIWKRKFSSPGTAAEGSAPVSSLQSNELHSRVISFQGKTLVVFATFNNPSFPEVKGRLFDASGVPQGLEFLIHAPDDPMTPIAQEWPGVAVNDEGDVLVVWDHRPQGATVSSVKGKLFPKLMVNGPPAN
jgi:cysteine-rich repeat protein